MPTGCGDCDKVKLAKREKPSCSACNPIESNYKKKRREELNKLDSEVKNWFADKDRKVKNTTSQMGKINFSKKAVLRYLSHAYTPDSKELLKEVYSKPSELIYKETHKLGENKDLGNKKDTENIRKKEMRGVLGYIQYEYRDYVIGFENIKNKYEEPYYVYKKKKAK